MIKKPEKATELRCSNDFAWLGRSSYCLGKRRVLAEPLTHGPITDTDNSYMIGRRDWISLRIIDCEQKKVLNIFKLPTVRPSNISHNRQNVDLGLSHRTQVLVAKLLFLPALPTDLAFRAHRHISTHSLQPIGSTGCIGLFERPSLRRSLAITSSRRSQPANARLPHARRFRPLRSPGIAISASIARMVR